jgi:hypothetical protein
MLYHIKGYNPQYGMEQSGFIIQLWPTWKEAVMAYKPESGCKLTQRGIDKAIERLSPSWLEGHGFRYTAALSTSSIRASLGDWGLEHITVPGNACGLDMDDHALDKPIGGGAVLLPHNVDSPQQASLLLTVFLWFADCIVTDMEVRKILNRR